MATASLCSSWACSVGPVQSIDYPASETLQSIVAGALSISGSLSISPSGINPSGIMQRRPAFVQKEQHRGTAKPALQQMLPQLPLPMLVRTPVQPADGLPLSPTGVSWQDAWRTAAVAAAARSSKDEESQKPASIRPSARRCLCLTLTQQQRDETLDAAASAALPPVAPFTPLPGKCSISSSTPGSAWSAVPAEATAAAPSAHGGSSSSVCSHGSSSNRSRLQAWLSTMELQLQVPATPLVPPVEPCPAPKGGHSRADAHDSRKRALDAEALSELRLAPGPAAAGTGAAAMKAAGDAERSRKRRNSSSEAVSAAAAVQIAAAVDGMPPGADAAGAQGAHMTDDSPVAGVAAAAVPDDLEAAAAAAGATNGVCLGAGGVTVPAPAFVLLGVLSTGHSSSSK